jgi:hypothetical protein
MTVIRFPGTFEGKEEPRAIYVCAPSKKDWPFAQKGGFGLGLSPEKATARFFEGGVNHGMKTRTFKVDTAPDWVKYVVVSQLMLFISLGQPLSSIDEDALAVLGRDASQYGDGPMPRRSSRSLTRAR